jgi:hypothetical protein
MQLGKLDVSPASQRVSCKTARKCAKADQRVAPAKQNAEFEPLEHSVYEGRRRLGRYLRIAPTWYAAYDAEDRPLGEFSRPQDAYAAVSGISGGGE